MTFHRYKVTRSERNSDVHMQKITVAFFSVRLDALAIDQF